MNSVVLIGRLTRDPELRYVPDSQLAVATFNLAIDRPVREGKEKQTDFPRITVFGRQEATKTKTDKRYILRMWWRIAESSLSGEIRKNPKAPENLPVSRKVSRPWMMTTFPSKGWKYSGGRMK